ncbi:PucR family transcriptional regulator ligand-binding domain-containing protein [Clostridia bacterium]|nr:PucR family transcriptional regulator ligand-binding domain-containing protein [Clostridia bacterium]
MKIRVVDLLSHTYFKTSRVLAGKQGLNNYISSIQVVENIDVTQYWRGGELVISSGYNFLDRTEEHKDLIKGLVLAGIAGLCITTNNLIDNKLPDTLMEAAEEYEFPVITFPAGKVFGEVCDFMNNHLFSRLTNEIKRRDEVIREINDWIYKEGLQGMLKALYKWTGMKTALLYEGNVLSCPPLSDREDEIIRCRHWINVPDNALLYSNVGHYVYRDKKGEVEWLGAKISTPSQFENFVMLFQENMEFTKDDEMLLGASLSACALEIKRLKGLSEEKAKHRENLFKSIIEKGISYEEARHQAAQLGYSLAKNSSIALMNIKKPAVSLSMEGFIQSFKAIVKELFPSAPFWVQPDDKTIVLILSDSDEEIIRSLYRKIQGLDQALTFTIGIGKSRTYDKICKSYQEALRAIEIGESLGEEANIYFFNQLGFYGFINVVEDREVMKSYYEDYILPLERQFKEEHLTEMLDTLSLFFEMRFSYAKTAEQMHVHRNTVDYRMAAIEKACNIDMRNYEDRFNMGIALKLLPLIRHMKEEL